MAFDGIVTRAIVNELKEKILFGRVDKIYQTERDELIINIYNKGVNYKLLISANSNHPRFHLTEVSKSNPQSPPMFCMLLRKHITSGIILNIEQLDNDRIVFLDISSLDELGNDKELRLVIEIMGRHSNVILIEKDTQKIIDSIYRVTEDISRVRQILPGLKYDFPPLQDKLNYENINFDEFHSNFMNFNGKQVYKFFYSTYTGLSPLISKELCYNADVFHNTNPKDLTNEEINKLFKSLDNFSNSITNNHFFPVYYTNKNAIDSFYCISLNSKSDFEETHFESMSKVLDSSFSKKDNNDRIRQKSQNIRKIIDNHIDRTVNKLEKQKNELKLSKDRDIFKVYADLLSANLYKLTFNTDLVVLENFYDEKLTDLEIPLDKKISPAQNANRYYKRYSKLKNAEILLTEQIPITKDEIEYLESILLSVEHCEDVSDLEVIEDELISYGYIKKKAKKAKSNNIAKSKPYHFKSSDGYDIYVGKNNKQNDELTLKFANKDDIWLHTQKIPGSHVIIRKSTNEDIPLSTITEAAKLAAYYSKARESLLVSVDYTEKKNISKAKGSKLGMVFYNDFETLLVDPKSDI